MCPNGPADATPRRRRHSKSSHRVAKACDIQAKAHEVFPPARPIPPPCSTAPPPTPPARTPSIPAPLPGGVTPAAARSQHLFFFFFVFLHPSFLAQQPRRIAMGRHRQETGPGGNRVPRGEGVANRALPRPSFAPRGAAGGRGGSSRECRARRGFSSRKKLLSRRMRRGREIWAAVGARLPRQAEIQYGKGAGKADRLGAALSRREEGDLPHLGVRPRSWPGSSWSLPPERSPGA